MLIYTISETKTASKETEKPESEKGKSEFWNTWSGAVQTEAISSEESRSAWSMPWGSSYKESTSTTDTSTDKDSTSTTAIRDNKSHVALGVKRADETNISESEKQSKDDAVRKNRLKRENSGSSQKSKKSTTSSRSEKERSSEGRKVEPVSDVPHIKSQEKVDNWDISSGWQSEHLTGWQDEPVMENIDLDKGSEEKIASEKEIKVNVLQELKQETESEMEKSKFQEIDIQSKDSSCLLTESCTEQGPQIEVDKMSKSVSYDNKGDNKQNELPTDLSVGETLEKSENILEASMSVSKSLSFQTEEQSSSISVIDSNLSGDSNEPSDMLSPSNESESNTHEVISLSDTDKSPEDDTEVKLESANEGHQTSAPEETVLEGEAQDDTVLDGEAQDDTVLDGEAQDDTVLDGEVQAESSLISSNEFVSDDVSQKAGDSLQTIHKETESDKDNTSSSFEVLQDPKDDSEEKVSNRNITSDKDDGNILNVDENLMGKSSVSNASEESANENSSSQGSGELDKEVQDDYSEGTGQGPPMSPSACSSVCSSDNSKLDSSMDTHTSEDTVVDKIAVGDEEEQEEVTIKEDSQTQKEEDIVEGDLQGLKNNDSIYSVSSSSSYVKCMIEEAMEDSGRVEDSNSDHDCHSTGGEKSECSRSTGGHESGDEIDTTTSSDIEIISTPNSNGDCSKIVDLSPLKIALQKTARRGSPTHRRSDSQSSSSTQSREGQVEQLSPGRDSIEDDGQYMEERKSSLEEHSK